MNIADVDRMAGYSQGFGPMAQALQWLDTLTRTPSVQWSPGQREAAQRVLKDARRVLYADLLQMARDALDGKTPPAAEAYLVPYDDTLKDADWDSLAKGTTPPYPLGDGWQWVRVLVYGAPNLQALPEDPNTAFQRVGVGPLVTQDGGASVGRDYNAAFDLTRAINQRRGAA